MRFVHITQLCIQWRDAHVDVMVHVGTCCTQTELQTADTKVYRLMVSSNLVSRIKLWSLCPSTNCTLSSVKNTQFGVLTSGTNRVPAWTQFYTQIGFFLYYYLLICFLTHSSRYLCLCLYLKQCMYRIRFN